MTTSPDRTSGPELRSGRPKRTPTDVRTDVRTERAGHLGRDTSGLVTHARAYEIDPEAREHWLTLARAIGAICRVTDCEQLTDARGMCSKHYCAAKYAAVKAGRVCELCGVGLIRRERERVSQYETRRFCGPRCATRGAHSNAGSLARAALMADRRDAILEDLEWLIDNGESTERIVTRLGFNSHASLEKALYRWQRPDLAALLRNAS